MFAAVAAWAVDGDSPYLVPETSWDKEAVFPGADVAVEVKYTNEGTASVPNDALVKFRLEIREMSADANKDPKVVRQSEEIDILQARGKRTGQTFSVSTQIVAPPEGNYHLVAILTVNEEATEYSELFGVQSALPPGLARLFAGLGMFAAVMAIMAVGTEVLMESVKFFLGMKQKVTALEALDLLKEELPGQLGELGVGLESQAKVDKLFIQLDTALDWLNQSLQPLSTAGEVYTAIQGEQFSAAFDGIKTLEKDLSDLQSRLTTETDKARKTALEDQVKIKIEEMKQAARTGVGQVLPKLKATFGLDQAIADRTEKALDKLIDGITVHSVLASTDHTAQLVGGIFREIQKNGPDWTANWLKVQADTYVAAGSSQVVGLLDREVLPVLTDLGFPAASVQTVRSGLAERIDSFQVLLQEKAATYTLAVRNLLQAVEEKRNDMQSPGRKIWRRLRESDQLSFWPTFIGAVVGIAFLLAACLLRLPASWPVFWVRLVIAAAGVVIFAIWIRIGWHKTPSLGQGLCTIERFWNTVMGRKEKPEKFGQVEADVQDEIAKIGPTNVAAILLKREDKHQDEEASRIRALRILSIFVGSILAYMLQIDALLLLEEALPGAAKINMTLVNAQQAHGLWSVLNYDLTVGIVLTGLAAGAGSKFWRDLLGRLQATKKQAESAAILLRKTKTTLGLEEE
jgi:hypothetical protein